MSTNRRSANKKAKHGGGNLPRPTGVAIARPHHHDSLDRNLSEVETLLGECDQTYGSSRGESFLAVENSIEEKQINKPVPSVDLNSAVLALLENKIQQIVENTAQLERDRIEIQEARRQLKHAIDSAELRIAQIDSGTGEDNSSFNTGIVESLRAENERLVSLLNHTRAEYQTLLDFIENEDIKELTSNIRNEHLERECELNRELDRLKEKVKLLEDEIGSSIGTGSEAEFKKTLASVRNELIDARHEVVDVRLHCNELASRLAKFQDPSTVNHDSVSWEDRKQALLQMLEEQDQQELSSAENVIEMKQILEETSVQIQIREKEIADLRSLLEQQSIAANGFAVGAAAVANLVDADEIVAEERQRLKEMQLQWEQKQRQGEIEMSLERAKLARERLEIHDKLQQLEAERDRVKRAAENASQLSPAPHKGRWWARLGLKDD
ncbi:MAG: hypothetical protein ACK5PB_17715 [Pirellula sp.]|jgi:hypothetical protein